MGSVSGGHEHAVLSGKRRAKASKDNARFCLSVILRISREARGEACAVGGGTRRKKGMYHPD